MYLIELKIVNKFSELTQISQYVRSFKVQR